MVSPVEQAASLAAAVLAVLIELTESLAEGWVTLAGIEWKSPVAAVQASLSLTGWALLSMVE